MNSHPSRSVRARTALILTTETRLPLEEFILPTSPGKAIVAMNLPFEKPGPGSHRASATVTRPDMEEPITLESNLKSADQRRKLLFRQ